MQTLHRQSLADGRKKQNMLKQRGKRARQQRKLQLERLEDRRLLAGPELFAIRPDAQALLNPGDVLHIAPREFNLLFKGGADIDPNTIASGVRLVRANGDNTFGDGNDVSVSLGFAGLTDPNNPVQIVMRPASSAQFNSVSATTMFPDDLYRIEVLGTGAGALKNKAGQAFNSGKRFQPGVPPGPRRPGSGGGSATDLAQFRESGYGPAARPQPDCGLLRRSGPGTGPGPGSEILPVWSTTR